MENNATLNIFEFASRNKLRFQYRGILSVEDLWDLRVEDLDAIYKNINAEKKKHESEESLLNKKSNDDIVYTVSIEIIKHIVFVKQKEKEERDRKVANAAKKQKIMEILADRSDKALEEASDEELNKMLDELCE